VKHFTLVSVRDSGSAGELREVGMDCRIVPDLSLYTPAGEPGTARGSDVGFVDSVDRFTALDIDRLCMERGGHTLSIFYLEQGVSGYLGFIRQGVAKSDLRSPATLAQLVRMRHRIYRGSTEDTEAFLHQLSGLRLLVSGRFHACTLALLVDTPFVALTSNTRKIESLIRDAGLEKWRCAADVASIDIDAAVRQGWSAAERESIADYVASSRDSAERLFREMRALLQ
jgi:polysaccharide pyruvyl transferase WcaK-like protein